ncbi:MULTISPECIES: ABC transporter ATP-binding protein [Streptomyces]|uniref:ABC transporter ATP-binding protein n=1 Tax=Streptomyces solicathayae TaxID=3081768 RepID=A0ABZ0M213_9ACTN|nr:ABC transporter ATP-binding protein [Streptomyces sp. HUAS YS2]WOX25808.1 ABC transporter ATP-binding protein [Streptomyces sp. HUAS YS2]
MRLSFLVGASALSALVTAASPLLFGMVIDKGIVPGKMDIVVWVAGALLALALVDALTQYFQAKLSAQIGEGLVYDLRTQVFRHVQAQPIGFFTRAQTGSLVSRLNTDVIGAQQAITVLMAETVNTVLTLILILGAMFYLSWQLSLVALLIVPLFLIPGKAVGRRMQHLARGSMQLNAEMGSLMNERFNVAGAMLNKLFGSPARETAYFSERARAVRDIGVKTNVTAQMLGIIMGVTASVTLALLFGFGGALVVKDVIAVGTLVSLVTLVGRLYTPIQQLSSVQANAMTALVSFDRVFEILDLDPLVKERPGAVDLPSGTTGAAPEVHFDSVSFRYPSADEVALASLESTDLGGPERDEEGWVLDGISFRAPAGKLTALVGRSGAGKTTITNLMPRFYDPVSGTVRIDGHDLRDLTTQSLQDTIGVVTQDAHLFHDTIRANLLYARTDATEPELIEACRAAQVWGVVESLPNGLDTVVGDRGFRLSGGEKQRIALARLLLKAPPVVVLDEATAHLDAESEVAIQRALKSALQGRTSVVIAHRLSTIREADQILVIDDGQVRESGTHEQLLAAGDLYADLYHTQFARQATENGEVVLGSTAGPVS